DSSQIETGKPRSSKKEQPKPEPAKPAAEVKETPKAVEAPAPEVPVAQTPKPAETATPAIPAIQESENLGDNKIETVYQKLDGPKILKQTVDLSQFNKPKSQGANSAAAKKKRKRIEKPNPTGGTAQSGTAGSGGQGNRPGGQGNRPAGNRPPQQGGNKPGGSRRGADRVMPVELTDEQVKNQIRETLEKLTNKGGKSKGSKYRKEKRTYRREQDELQEQIDAADR